MTVAQYFIYIYKAHGKQSIYTLHVAVMCRWHHQIFSVPDLSIESLWQRRKSTFACCATYKKTEEVQNRIAIYVAAKVS